MMLAIATTIVVFAIMIAEMQVSRRNERVLRSRGAIEPHDDVYKTMTWAYPVSFVAMGIEGLIRGGADPRLVIVGIVVFGIAKALKFWAIHSLGTYWSFRVLVVPNHRLVADGPYRFVRHPNYVAVAGEMLGVALLLGAFVSGALATAGFVWLMRRRIAIEERALGLTASR